jgi:transposase
MNNIPPKKSRRSQVGRARIKIADRKQKEWRDFCLDQLLPPDHQARIVWAFVEQLDLSLLYSQIQAVEGCAGQDAIDPQILVTLWLYATIDGVGSGRRLDRLCKEHTAYQWICGGVSVNHHTLSDFHTKHMTFLDGLFIQGVASLMHQGLVELNRIAQDGMRVRASAGSSSFRSQGTLEECLKDAKAHLEDLQREQDEDGGTEDRRVQSAQQRAAEERQQRIEAALAERDKLAQKMERREKGSGVKARASTTDPEARVMKMADGGFRPAYNVQFASTADTQVIVSVDVTNAGTDGGLMVPMVEQIQKQYGRLPQEYLADGGFGKLDDITCLGRKGMLIYTPIMEEDKKRAKGVDPHAPMKGDTPEVAAWRKRMGEPEAKAIYKQRASSAEFANAGCRNRGLLRFQVRGLAKAKAVALWHAIAHNFQRMLALQATLKPAEC